MIISGFANQVVLGVEFYKFAKAMFYTVGVELI